jgi:hypothetical protein
MTVLGGGARPMQSQAGEGAAGVPAAAASALTKNKHFDLYMPRQRSFTEIKLR